MNVHFICRGNVLRSVIAEAYLKSLNLNNINVISSGTSVNWGDPTEREYFARTLSLLRTHGLESFAKHNPDPLTQDRVDTHHDLVVLMNQRVLDEAKRITTLPTDAITWKVTDIGEGSRTDNVDLDRYEEQIYVEITKKVDGLFRVRS